MKTKKRTRTSLTLTWYGHSAFHIRAASGGSVLIDPWLDNPRAPANAKDDVAADVILITHGHSDHLGNCIEIAQRTGAQVVAIYEVHLFLQSKGVARTVGMNKGGTLSLGGLRVTMVEAKHSSGIDADGTVIPGGEAAGYVVRFEEGGSVYHAGDTALFGDMKLIRQLYAPALVILPIGDLYTMAPREAALACQMLAPKQIVGMHYGTFPALTGTPGELRKHLPASLKKRVVELEIGVPRSFA